MPEKVLFGFSGGKDSCLALHQLMQDTDYEVLALLTTLTEEYRRISMHGVREALLEQQAQRIGLTLEKVWIPPAANNDIYETRMRKVLEKYRQLGVNRVVFGDIFLTDIREYREKQLAEVDMQALFPLWGIETQLLVDRFLSQGFKAITCCVDSRALDKTYVGRLMDQQFFDSLPPGVDLCGENGEFHSFVYDGPVFNESVHVSTGEVVRRDEHFY